MRVVLYILYTLYYIHGCWYALFVGWKPIAIQWWQSYSRTLILHLLVVFRSLASLAVGEPIPLNQSADGDLVTGR